MNRAICIIGMDGSGKTTHARRLIAHLEESGIRCRYVWFGAAYFLSYPFMVICRMLGLTKISYPSKDLSVSEHRYYRNKSISSVWPWVQLLDLAFIVSLRVKLPIYRRFTVVCDRFIPDILVDLMADVNDDRLCERMVGQLILSLIPRHSLLVFLSVDEKTAWRRKSDVPELGYLIRRKKWYNRVSNHLRMPVVNSQGSVASVQERLVSLIDELMTQTR